MISEIVSSLELARLLKTKPTKVGMSMTLFSKGVERSLVLSYNGFDRQGVSKLGETALVYLLRDPAV